MYFIGRRRVPIEEVPGTAPPPPPPPPDLGTPSYIQAINGSKHKFSGNRVSGGLGMLP